MFLPVWLLSTFNITWTYYTSTLLKNTLKGLTPKLIQKSGTSIWGFFQVIPYWQFLNRPLNQGIFCSTILA